MIGFPREMLASLGNGSKSRVFSTWPLLLLCIFQTLLIVHFYFGVVQTPEFRHVDGPRGNHGTGTHAHEVLAGQYSSATELLLRELFKGFTTPVDAPDFVNHDGIIYSLPNRGRQYWNKPLGKRLCLLDIDGRPFDDENEPWTKEQLSWSNVTSSSSGILNHYAYALMHGYDYKYIRTTKPSWGNPVWSKIPAIKSVLGSYDVVVSLDSDTVFTNLHLPYEWLMNRWEITGDGDDALLAMAHDRHQTPGIDGPNIDHNGKPRQNPGFLTVRNRPLAHEALERWTGCPFEIPGCSAFRERFPAEMGAWNEHVRYVDDGKYGAITKHLPCAEANGFPGQQGECNGVFLRHYTSDKPRVKEGVTDAFGHAFANMIHGDMLQQQLVRLIVLSKFGEGANVKPEWE
jgi:hypothetical protein